MLIFKALIILFFYIFTYYTFGVFFNRITRNNESGVAFTFVVGMFLYASLYFVYVMPFKIKNYSVHKFSMIWALVYIILVILIMILCRKSYLKPARRSLSWIRDNKFNFWFVSFIVIGLILYVEIFGYLSYSHNTYDYISYPLTAIHNDVAGVYDNSTGLIRVAYDSRQLVQTFLDHSATVAIVFNTHPLIEIRDVFPIISLVVESMLVWLLSLVVCKENKPGQFLFFTVYQAVWIGSSCSAFMSGYYGLFRICEGKNVYASITVPLGLYVIWRLLENPRDTKALWFGFVGICGSLTFTGAALFVWPVAMIGVLLKLFSKDWKWSIINYLVLNLPCLVYGIYYYMGTISGKLDLSISI